MEEKQKTILISHINSVFDFSRRLCPWRNVPFHLLLGLMLFSHFTLPLARFLLAGQFDKMKSPFEWDIVTRGLVAMTIEGFVGFFITIMFQYNFFRKPQ